MSKRRQKGIQKESAEVDEYITLRHMVFQMLPAEIEKGLAVVVKRLPPANYE
jgi:hypothetical protein